MRGSAGRAQYREVDDDDVLPPHRVVFGVIVVALILREVYKHLKVQTSVRASAGHTPLVPS